MSLDSPYAVMARLLKAKDVTGIIDVGASDGRVAKRLIKRFPRATCHLFEPNPVYADALKRLAEEDARYAARYLAVADHVGERTLYLAADPGPSSLYPPTERARRVWGPVVETSSTLTVPTVALDDWAQDENIGPIQLIKFDIQSGELAALRGARRLIEEQVLLIYTEVMCNAMYQGGALFGEIDLLLRESGFVLYDIYRPSHDGNGALIQANAIFVHADRLGL